MGGTTLPISSRRSQTPIPDANGETRRTPRRTRLWLATFFGFFAMSMAWSFATPYDGFADELRHVARAYTVAGGEFVYNGPMTDDVPWLTVPKSLSPRGSELTKTNYTSCFNWDSSKNASCAVPPGREADKHTMVLVPTGAAQYNPVYYAMVGGPLRWWPDYRGIYAARALSAAYNCALIAFCVTACASVRRGRILLSGMLVALTPVVVNFTAGINPAGIEMTGGLAFWTAGVLMAARRRTTPGLLALGAVGAAILATVRGGGLLWLALNLGVLVFLVPLRRWWPTAKRLWQERAVRWWTAFVALAVVGALGWVAIQNPNNGAFTAKQPTPSFAQMTVNSVSQNVWGRGEFLVNGIVALGGFSDTWPPGFLWSIWFMSFGVVIFGALVFSPWRGRLQLLALIIGSAVVTLAADIVPMSQGHTLSQGRYVIPVLVGVPLLGAWFLYRSGILDLPRNRTLTRAYVVVLLPLQMVVLYVSMLRYQQGLSQPFPINPFKGQWLPSSGPYLPFFLAVTALVAIGAVFWRVSGEDEDDPAAPPAASPAAVPAPAGAAD
ncbi:MAG: DUF2142 domain-containing protein [Catenulispora sp.]